jgi:hypothetical protein
LTAASPRSPSGPSVVPRLRATPAGQQPAMCSTRDKQ